VTANGVMVRDSSGNVQCKPLVTGYRVLTLTSNTTTLTAASEGHIRVTSGSGTIKLPATSGLATGLEFDIYNYGSGTVNITDSTLGALATLTAGMFNIFVVNTAGSGWDVIPIFRRSRSAERCRGPLSQHYHFSRGGGNPCKLSGNDFGVQCPRKHDEHYSECYHCRGGNICWC